MSHLQSILNPESCRQQLSVTTLEQRSSSVDQRSSSADDEISPTSSDEVDELHDESEGDEDEDLQILPSDDGPDVSEGDEHELMSRRDGTRHQRHLDPNQSAAPRRKLEKHDRKIDLGLHDHKTHANCPDTLACLPDTNGRPQHTLPVILRCAILGSPRKRLTIREIYAAMESKYPYYKSAGQTWKQSVRHHLSLNRLFERQPRPVTDPGFGSYWTVNLEAPPGTKRPRKRGRPNRETGEGSSRKTILRAQPQIQSHVQPQHNLPQQPTQFQFQPQTHPTPPLPPSQHGQVQVQVHPPVNGPQSPVPVHSPTRSQQQAVQPQPLPVRQQNLQQYHQSHPRHPPQQLSPVQSTSHQPISQQYQNQPQTRHMREPASMHQLHPPHQRQPSYHGQSFHQSQSSHQGQPSHQSQSSHHVQYQSQNHGHYNSHHQPSQSRQSETLHRYHAPPPQRGAQSTPSTPLSGRESIFPPSSSSETEDGGRITHEEDNGPTVSDDEHESEEEILRHTHSRQPSGQGQAFIPTRSSSNYQLPPFSALEPTTEDTWKQMREEITTLRRTTTEAVSTSMRLSEQLANANLEVSRSREAVRDLEDMLHSETTKRCEAERLKEIEIERRRAAEQALNGRPRPSGT